MAPSLGRVRFIPGMAGNAAHAASLGAQAEKVGSLGELEPALARARAARKTAVVVIDTDGRHSTGAGGAWWDVPVSDAARSAAGRVARQKYERARTRQTRGA